MAWLWSGSSTGGAIGAGEELEEPPGRGTGPGSSITWATGDSDLCVEEESGEMGAAGPAWSEGAEEDLAPCPAP